jgi:hypothetical protein
LLAEADPALEVDARALLGRLAERAVAMSPGETALVEWDWVRMRLEASPAAVFATEAEAAANAPIDMTLEQLAFQARLLDRLGAAGRPLQPGQYSRISVDALEAAAVIAARAEDPDAMFSGWQVEGVGAANAVHGLYSTGEISKLRRFWLPALSLPPNWSLHIDNGVLTECRAPDGAVHSLGLPLPGGRPR